MNMPPLPYVKRIPGLDYDALKPAYTDPSVWDSFDPTTITLEQPRSAGDPAAGREGQRAPGHAADQLQMRAGSTTTRARRSCASSSTTSTRRASIRRRARSSCRSSSRSTIRSSCRSPNGRCCCAGNYRCVTKDGMRTAQEAVHSDIETSRSVYNFVFDLCVKLGAKPDDLVPFEKYAAAAQSLTRPASAARALQNGAPNIERADKLVQLIARQKGLSHPAIDATGGAGRRAARGQSQEAGGVSSRIFSYTTSTSCQKPNRPPTCAHLRPRRFVGPRGARMARAVDDDVVELHAVRTGPVVRGLCRSFAANPCAPRRAENTDSPCIR